MTTAIRSKLEVWWGQILIDVGCTNIEFDFPEICVANEIWKKKFPIIYYLTSDIEDKLTYWRTVKNLLNFISDNRNNEKDKIDFLDIVDALYEYQNILVPRTVEDGLKLIGKYNQDIFKVNPIYFVSYTLPLFLNNHLLYVKLLVKLMDLKHKFWVGLVRRNTYGHSFLQYYIPLLTPIKGIRRESHDLWVHRQLLADIIFNIINDGIKFNIAYLTLAAKYIDRLLRLIPSAPPNIEISFVRYILSICKRSAHKVSKDIISSRFLELIRYVSVDKNDQSFCLVFFYILNSKPKVLAGSRLLRILNNRKLRSTMDLNFAYALSNVMDPVPVLTFFAQNGLSSKVYHRACFSKIREILCRFSTNLEVSEWSQTLIRSLFTFILISHLKQKYRGKSLLICESLANMANLHVTAKSIATAVASLTATRLAPAYVNDFFLVSVTPDPDLVSEFLQYSQSFPTDFKIFPFDKKGQLIRPHFLEKRELTHSSPRSQYQSDPKKIKLKMKQSPSKFVSTLRPSLSKLPALNPAKGVRK